MRFFTLLLLLLALFACRQKEVPPPAALVQRAEYEPTRAVWMQWPNYVHRADMPLKPLLLEMLAALAPHAPVRLLAPNDSVRAYLQALLPSRGLDTSRIRLLVLPYSEFWARDMGPRFLSDGKGRKAIADFGFNTWSYLDAGDSLAQLDEKLDERIAAHLGLPLLSSDLIAEGGDNEMSAEGVLMLTESVQRLRNPALSRVQIEKEYTRLLGAKHFIWLDKGLRDDDFSLAGPIPGPGGSRFFTCLTTNGHVDEYARFANDSTILLARGDTAATDPIERESARRMLANYKILARARRPSGRPYRIVPLPLVPAITAPMQPGDGPYDFLAGREFEDGYRFGLRRQPENMVAAASYLNFVIANDLLLAPRYGLPGDSAALSAFRTAFPGKKIILLNPLALNWGGGGMHCITANEPY